MSADYRYRLRYDIQCEAGKFTKAELPPLGGTDAFVFISILYPPDGSMSLNFMTVDGRNPIEGDGLPPRLSDDEIFKVWLLLGKRLGRSRTLERTAAEYADHVSTVWFEMARKHDGQEA